METAAQSLGGFGNGIRYGFDLAKAVFCLHGTPEPMLLEPHVLVFHDGIWYLKAKLLERSGRVLAETPVSKSTTETSPIRNRLEG